MVSTKVLETYLNKICVVRWADAHTEIRANLSEFMDVGPRIFNTVGWLHNIGHGGIVLVSEKPESEDNTGDATYIPKGMILSIKGGKDVDSD